MKRTAVLKKIQRAAKVAEVNYVEPERSNHTGLIVGSVRTTIGRRSDVAEGTAEALYKQLQPALGEWWWTK